VKRAFLTGESGSGSKGLFSAGSSEADTPGDEDSIGILWYDALRGDTMAVATFETLKFANTLKAAGVPDKQAEAQAMAFADVIQINFKDMVVKDDLKNQSELLEAKIKESELRVRSELTLLRWMVGSFGAGIIAIIIRIFIIRTPI